MKPEDRKAIKGRLDELAKKHKTLTPQIVVADAKSSKSPLHGYFDWNDEKAAHQWRLDQARSLITQFRVEVRTVTRSVVVPAYVRDPRKEKDEQGYVAIVEARDDRAIGLELMRYEMSRLIATIERVKAIGESVGMGEKLAALLTDAQAIEADLGKPKQRPATVGIGNAIPVAAN